MRRCAFLFLLPFALTAAAQQKDKDKQDKPEPPVANAYYPLQVGREWTYRSGKETVTVRVDKQVPLDLKKDDKSTKVTGYVLRIGSGPREATEQVAALADGVYRFTTAGKAIRPPLRFLKSPIKAGETWPIESKTADGKTYSGTFVAGSAVIQVTLNGRMTELPTVTVKSKDLRIDDKKIEINYWFAETIGMVKEQVRIGTGEMVTLELTAVTPAK
jgi:hypothetical protein